jgi:hypothetical protein
VRRIALALFLALPTSAGAQPALIEDVVPGVPFQEGDVIRFDSVDRLKDYLPPEFWAHREFFFYEGMEIEIGPFRRDYTPSSSYEAASRKDRGGAKLGRDGALEGFMAGRPFEPEAIDCTGDPDAGTKIIWNFTKAWNGSGGRTQWYYSYWDRGEQLPLYYKGTFAGVLLAHRVEPQYEKTARDVFKNERRLSGGGIHVLQPFDARGIMTLNYRYKASDGPLDKGRTASRSPTTAGSCAMPG